MLPKWFCPFNLSKISFSMNYHLSPILDFKTLLLNYPCMKKLTPEQWIKMYLLLRMVMFHCHVSFRGFHWLSSRSSVFPFLHKVEIYIYDICVYIYMKPKACGRFQQKIVVVFLGCHGSLLLSKLGCNVGGVQPNTDWFTHVLPIITKLPWTP